MYSTLNTLVAVIIRLTSFLMTGKLEAILVSPSSSVLGRSSQAKEFVRTIKLSILFFCALESESFYL
jgi:hypothetical protein